eukprot:6687438-Pyramimonas_sp.AAC.1
MSCRAFCTASRISLNVSWSSAISETEPLGSPVVLHVVQILPELVPVSLQSAEPNQLQHCPLPFVLNAHLSPAFVGVRRGARGLELRRLDLSCRQRRISRALAR